MSYLTDEIASQPECWSKAIGMAGSVESALPGPGERVAAQPLDFHERTDSPVHGHPPGPQTNVHNNPWQRKLATLVHAIQIDV